MQNEFFNQVSPEINIAHSILGHDDTLTHATSGNPLKG